MLSMTELQCRVTSPAEISSAAARLRQAVFDVEASPDEVITVLEAWGKRLDSRHLDGVPGIVFLRIWLRRGTLEPIIDRELGSGGISGGWSEYGRSNCKAFPLGVVGHWPAGNVEIQPILSMTCALLGGNAALVRVPTALVDLTQCLIEKLVESDSRKLLTSRIFMAAFEHDRQDLHEVMARSVDGAMIWGGQEAVLQVRALPFPYWARLAIFGPRISVAAMDSGAWGNPHAQESWCRRIARDVWQFDQQACSSPQVLYLENGAGLSISQFVQSLRLAFEAENHAHPRQVIPAALTSAICNARANWLLKDASRRAFFSPGPDWTLLIGSGPDLPRPIQGKTLIVSEVANLSDPILRFDGNVQTLGLGMVDAEKEQKLASLAGERGVESIRCVTERLSEGRRDLRIRALPCQIRVWKLDRAIHGCRREWHPVGRMP